jgi:hypothetical protein
MATHAIEPAIETMPTTAEIILQAAAVLEPILPPEFYGKIVLIFEKGKPLRLVQETSIKL